MSVIRRSLPTVCGSFIVALIGLALLFAGAQVATAICGGDKICGNDCPWYTPEWGKCNPTGWDGRPSCSGESCCKDCSCDPTSGEDACTCADTFGQPPKD